MAYNHPYSCRKERPLARRSSQKHRPAQILFLILSILVVLSMALGYLLTALPTPPPPTPTPVVFLAAPLLVLI